MCSGQMNTETADVFDADQRQFSGEPHKHESENVMVWGC